MQAFSPLTISILATLVSQLPTVMISRHDSSILRNMTHVSGTFLRARIYAREHPSFDPASAILVALGASTAMLAAWLSAGSERRVVCGGKLKASSNDRNDSTAAGVEGESRAQAYVCPLLVSWPGRPPSDSSNVPDVLCRFGPEHWCPARAHVCPCQLLLARPALLLYPRCDHLCHCPLLLCCILGHDLDPHTGRRAYIRLAEKGS